MIIINKKKTNPEKYLKIGLNSDNPAEMQAHDGTVSGRTARKGNNHEEQKRNSRIRNSYFFLESELY